MRTIIEDTKDYRVYHHTGMTRYRGCQCFGDCSCRENFKSEPYDYYTVKKKFNKHKTTVHGNLEQVKSRIELLLSIPVEIRKYHEE